MQSDNKGNRGILQAPRLNHGPGAPGGFLSRLKEQSDAVLQFVFDGLQNPGRSQKRRCMEVVSAGVHDAGDFRLEGRFCAFLYRQSVDVRPDTYRSFPVSSVNRGDYAVSCHMPAILHSHRVQFPADQLLRLRLPAAELRTAMKGAADLHSLMKRVFNNLINVLCHINLRDDVFNLLKMPNMIILFSAEKGNPEIMLFALRVNSVYNGRW